MGRAGAGGYATVQHAYDTRLKRDVAIKCIQITQADIDRSRVSIHDAQIENASRAFGAPRARRDDNRRGAQAPADGESAAFVPLTQKISEPSFFSSREKNAERLAKRRSYFKEAKANVAGSAVRGRTRVADTEDFEDDARGSGESFDLDEFAGYSSFKGGRAGAGAGRQHRRDMSSFPIGKNDTVGLSAFAGHIPGRIAGAGEVDISAVGEHSISIDAISGDGDSVDAARERRAAEAGFGRAHPRGPRGAPDDGTPHT